MLRSYTLTLNLTDKIVKDNRFLTLRHPKLDEALDNNMVFSLTAMHPGIKKTS